MLLDIHTHIDAYRDDSLDYVLGEIKQNKILSVSNSMDYLSYKRNCEIGEKNNLVLPIFGIHPWNAPHYVDKLDSLKPYIEESLMLGEIGLDYHFVKDPHQQIAQRTVFEFFLNEAKRLEKVVIIHTKGAEDDVLRMLKHYSIERAVIHWYSGPIDCFRGFSDMGCYFTIGFMVCHSDFVRVMARRLPPERILTETDNPGGFEWYSKKQGMPSLITDIIKEIARVRNRNRTDIENTIWDNFMNMLTYEERSVIMGRIKGLRTGPVIDHPME